MPILSLPDLFWLDVGNYKKMLFAIIIYFLPMDDKTYDLLRLYETNQ